MKDKRGKLRSVLFDLVTVIFGSACFALSIHYFTAPNSIAPGGVSGIATLVDHLTGAPIGAVSLLINIPLLILGFIYLGKAFIAKSFLAIVLFSVFVDAVFTYLPVYQGDHLLAALFGGVLMGLGLGVIFTRNASTGGTDIVVKLTQRRFPHLSMGNLMFGFDALVILSTAFVYGNIESALYSTVTIFVSSKVIDGIIYGRDRSKKIMIVTAYPEELATAIFEKIHRGVTFLKGEGAYTGKEKKILLICVKRNEFFDIKKIVREIDPQAFMMISDVNEALGQGFKDLRSRS